MGVTYQSGGLAVYRAEFSEEVRPGALVGVTICERVEVFLYYRDCC